MAKSTYDTIIIEWPLDYGPIYKEDVSGGAITPGTFLDLDGSGDLIEAGASGSTKAARKWVAVENPFADPETASDAIDQNWASGDTVKYAVPPPGTVVYAWLADGETVVKGDPLTTAANGELVLVTEAATVHEEAIVAYAAEGKTASGAAARVLVEIA